MKYLTAKEVYYLAEYIDVEEFMGIPYESPDQETMSILIQKGILGKKGQVCTQTVGYVELLRMYQDAHAYIHFQEYIFAICKDGKLTICKIMDGKEERLYGIVLGDIMTMLRLMLTHPILSYELAKRNKQTPKELRACNLVIELFDKDFQCLDEYSIEYDGEHWYGLDDDLQRVSYLDKEPEACKWLLERLPIDYKRMIQKKGKGVGIYE